MNATGVWGQVLPDIILLKNYESTRRFLLDNIAFRTIAHWGKAFQQVNLEACTITGQKGGREGKVKITIRHKDETTASRKLSQSVFEKLPGYKFNLHLTDSSWNILQKLSSLPRFRSVFDVHEGIHTGNVREKLFVNKKLNSKCRKLILGRDEVQRYHLHWNGQWVHYTKDCLGKNDYAGLGHPDYFETPKLVIRRTGDFVLACLDEDGYYFSNNVFVCLPNRDDIDLRFYLGLLNSRLLTWYYQTVQPRVGKMFAEIKINLINDFPIPALDLSDKKSRAHRDKLVSLVDQMLSAQEKLLAAISDTDRKTHTQRIEILDQQIDAIVYELYGLTDEEIGIVEG
ncbi:MAG: TaqI-like C-terminal specificity domain-containing protein [Thermoguttaceae bacterium]